MKALQRPGRAAAVIGGLVAVSATTVMALVGGTASAAEQGRCTENVNVRAEPMATARIVDVCDRGTTVTLGERRNGFVQLPDFGGWAVEQYVSTNSTSAPASGTATSSPTSSAATTTMPTATQSATGTSSAAAPASAANGGNGADGPNGTNQTATGQAAGANGTAGQNGNGSGAAGNPTTSAPAPAGLGSFPFGGGLLPLP